MARVYVIGTCDTKGEELHFAADCVRRAGADACIVDVSTAGSGGDFVASFHPRGLTAIKEMKERGSAISAMAVALTCFLQSRDDIGAVLGMGGSGNTALVTEAMRSLAVGIPKVMLSTMASGNVAPFLGPSDIMIMHSVADIAGLNSITRQVIANAAHAAAGMALNRPPNPLIQLPVLGFTMFGVTTPLISALRKALEGTHECLVFHATGVGGQCFEKLAESGKFSAVFDMTTTEVADFLIGGVLACTEDRFGTFIRNAMPYVGSVGACDMVNFGAREAVPQQFASRNLLAHNAHVTLMRTSVEENARIGMFIVDRLNRMAGPVRFLLPLRGISSLDAVGQPFHDRHADNSLFAAIRNGFQQTRQHKLIEVDAHINDLSFAEAALQAFKDMHHATI